MSVLLDDLELTEEEEAFRKEIRLFLETNMTDELRRASHFTMWALSEFEYGKRWQQILDKQGWGAVHWPEEYGGTGWSKIQKMIWNIECIQAQAPSVMSMGRDLCAPCIMAFGTEQQKALFLPRILAGEDWWAQGFSEPGVGSDLRALQLKAESTGDDFVLNGSKIWTSFANHANRIFCLVRSGTGPKKHDGISFLLIDMDSPGIEVHPITTIAGDEEICQVFFNDVRVPKARLLGKENEGWVVVRHLLAYEHGGGGGRSVALFGRYNWLQEIASLEFDGQEGSLIDDPDFGRQLAEIHIELEAASFASDELSKLARAGEPPSRASELLAIRSRIISQNLTELAMRAVGRYGLPLQQGVRKVIPEAEPVGPEHVLKPMPFYLGQRAGTIAGGTTEIHHNNVARHVLGL
ncbi:MAG: acyl-CoA dehydrogenase family protein [Pseudomonadales bacterium]|nr:acyl-CoA dehydrogenase family protein [Pseudomonadales bacterium]